MNTCEETQEYTGHWVHFHKLDKLVLIPDSGSEQWTIPSPLFSLDKILSTSSKLHSSQSLAKGSISTLTTISVAVMPLVWSVPSCTMLSYTMGYFLPMISTPHEQGLPHGRVTRRDIKGVCALNRAPSSFFPFHCCSEGWHNLQAAMHAPCK